MGRLSGWRRVAAVGALYKRWPIGVLLMSYFGTSVYGHKEISTTHKRPPELLRAKVPERVASSAACSSQPAGLRRRRGVMH